MQIMGNTVSIGQYNAMPPSLIDGEQRALRLDSLSRLITTNEKRATYSAAYENLASDALATDIFTIYGSATKTVVVKKVFFSGLAAGTQQIRYLLLKRSTANSGGTSVNMTVVPHDSTNVAGTAVPKVYTLNPTLGTLVGLVRTLVYTMMATTSNNSCNQVEINFGIEEDQGIVLRGVNEGLCLNLDATTITSSSINVSVEWREVVG